MGKLKRRGMVRTVRSDGGEVLELVLKGSSIAQTLLRTVVEHLTK
jgi:hypothetical protein